MSRLRKLYIDGNDAYEEYGVFLLDESYKNLVQYPQMKDVDYVDWPEENGIEPDLLNPVLAPKEGIVLSFACVRHPEQDNLFADLFNGAYHTFNFREIGVTAVLRLVEVANLEITEPLATFTLSLTFDYDFVEDFDHYEGLPSILSFHSNLMSFDSNLMLFTDYEELGGGHHINVKSYGFKIDGVDVSSFGILPLKGNYEEIARQDKVKENLTIVSKYIGGQTYDVANVRRSAREVSLSFLMRSSIPSMFWAQYKRFLTALVASGYRTLTYEGMTRKFYYESQAVNYFSLCPDNSVWCEFTLNLCFFEGN